MDAARARSDAGDLARLGPDAPGRRLRPVVDIDHARAELRNIAAGLAREHPATTRHRSADVQSLRERASGDIRPVLLVLLGAVGFVLPLTCSNIAGLTLARGAARRREVAMRKAVGAGRGRIVRQLLTESLLLAATAALLATVSLLAAFLPMRRAMTIDPMIALRDQ